MEKRSAAQNTRHLGLRGHRRWYDDGQTCDGTVALFGAVAGANLSVFTPRDAFTDATGDNAYDGGYRCAAAVDMASTLTDIRAENVAITHFFPNRFR